jgi:hypothetical protein
MWWDHTDLERIDDMQRIGCLPTWLIAFVVPTALAGLGILVIDAQIGYFPGRASGLVRVTDNSAIALGIALIAAGLFCHVRFGWTNWRLLHVFANPAMVIALLAFLSAVGYLIVRLASGAVY